MCVTHSEVNPLISFMEKQLACRRIFVDFSTDKDLAQYIRNTNSLLSIEDVKEMVVENSLAFHTLFLLIQTSKVIRKVLRNIPTVSSTNA